jgi:uncharacterized membrane-anchored protein
MMRQSWYATLLALVLCAGAARAQDAAVEQDAAEEREASEILKQFDWVKGPTTVAVLGNSTLEVPDGYLFLDTENTDRFLEMNQNIPSGQEVMIAPRDLEWMAYLSFNSEGYVKDDEQIDAAELLEALKEGSKASNKERARRGWSELHIIDWAVPPAYNTTNKRLEWATLLESEGGRGVNFSTKVLSRRGHTSVILVSSPEQLPGARPQLETVLTGYRFDEGERYADFVPGDKVATYGLAALVLGGAAAIATKKGLWAVIGAFIISKIKILIAALVGVGALLKKFVFGKKASGGG